uniref:PTC1-like winged helix-turn-helix domain-containing protein n=1 Tax=Kalanchoe fedtschenkoi TaxID=63787 RepID=A0A7N0RBF7_KALFE
MVRSVVCKRSPLSSLKKQTTSPPSSLRMQSISLKKQSVSPPSSSIILHKDMIKTEHVEENEANESYGTRGSKGKHSPLFGKSELYQMVKRSDFHSHKRCKRTKQTTAGRWSTTRYEQAEENMLKIMKCEGAVFGNPISRTALRSAARKFIGDTGLLDHLLKHMDGKVAPGGCERFRRWHNFNGQMEYWLESADLFDIRKEAGIQDPFWMPPTGWKPGCSPSDSSGFPAELKMLREEMDKMKRDFQVLMLKKAEEDKANHTPSSSAGNQEVNSGTCFASMQSEMSNWREKIKKQLYEISSSLGSVQDACINLEKWKGRIEQKLLDVSISVSTMQKSRRSNTFSPSVPDNWDFFSNPDLVGAQSDDFASWLGGSELIDLQLPDYGDVPWMESFDLIKEEPDMNPLNSGPTYALELYPSNNSSKERIDAGDLEIIKKEMYDMKRELHNVSLKKDDDGHATLMSDSSVSDGSKPDLENSILMLQDFYQDVVKMKADIERQVKEISTSLHGSEVSTQHTI